MKSELKRREFVIFGSQEDNESKKSRTTEEDEIIMDILESTCMKEMI